MKNLLKDIWLFIVLCFDYFKIARDEIKKEEEIRKSLK
jgi:hypothetical protein